MKKNEKIKNIVIHPFHNCYVIDNVDAKIILSPDISNKIIIGLSYPEDTGLINISYYGDQIMYGICLFGDATIEICEME